MLSPRTTALIVAFALLAGARANEGPRTELLDGVPTPEHLGKVDEVTVTTEDPPTPPEPTPKPLPSCADATNCFDCFLQQECYTNPFGEPVCEPCGWCASNHSSYWASDVKGECVVAALSVIDFCQFVDPGADRYCPETVCKVGDWGCACKDNVCPAIEYIIGFFTMEGLIVILVILSLFSVCLAAVCIYSVCRKQPQKIVVVQYDPAHHGPPGAGSGAQVQGGAIEGVYARMA